MLSAAPLIIDCDTGRDDALAIWLALLQGRDLSALVVSYGNTVRDNVTENCLRVLNFAGRTDIDVLIGANTPANAHKNVDAVIEPRQKLSGNGMCNLELPRGTNAAKGPLDAAALADAVATIASKKGKIDYVITGPATNFAAIAKALGPRLRECIARVTMMGGKTGALWDAMPGADFNIACDPYAIDAILDAGIDFRLVTMNTTWGIALPLDAVEALEPDTKIAAFARDLMIAHCRHFAPEPVFRFHDPSVVAVLDDDAHFKETRITVDLDESSSEFGRILETENGKRVKLHVCDDAYRAALLKSMLSGLGFRKAAQAA